MCDRLTYQGADSSCSDARYYLVTTAYLGTLHVHLHRGEGYIDICIDTYIYILYTFAHIHTTYVYTRIYIYNSYKPYIYI